jgi:hypothetical protein
LRGRISNYNNNNGGTAETDESSDSYSSDWKKCISSSGTVGGESEFPGSFDTSGSVRRSNLYLASVRIFPFSSLISQNRMIHRLQLFLHFCYYNWRSVRANISLDISFFRKYTIDIFKNICVSLNTVVITYQKLLIYLVSFKYLKHLYHIATMVTWCVAISQRKD